MTYNIEINVLIIIRLFVILLSPVNKLPIHRIFKIYCYFSMTLKFSGLTMAGIRLYGLLYVIPRLIVKLDVLEGEVTQVKVAE